MDGIEGLLERVRRETRGMMPLSAYVRLYETAVRAGGGTIVEIGTGQGAGTIAMALGAKSAGKPFRIVTVDPFGGRYSSRKAIGSVDDNLALVRTGFAAFGVVDCIEILVGTSRDLVEVGGIGDIAMLTIDADGRIDRDLALLFDHVVPDGAIVLDDVADVVCIYPVPGARLVDQKHRLTFLLAAALTERGLLVPEGMVGQTAFYRKGHGRLDEIEWAQVALPAYGELVFAELGKEETGIREFARHFLARRAPGALHAYRKLRRRPA